MWGRGGRVPPSHCRNFSGDLSLSSHDFFSSCRFRSRHIEGHVQTYLEDSFLLNDSRTAFLGDKDTLTVLLKVYTRLKPTFFGLRRIEIMTRQRVMAHLERKRELTQAVTVGNRIHSPRSQRKSQKKLQRHTSLADIFMMVSY